MIVDTCAQNDCFSAMNYVNGYSNATKLKLRQLNDDNESLIKGRKFIQIGATADAKLLDGGKPIQTLTTWLSIIWGRKIILALVNVFRGTL